MSTYDEIQVVLRSHGIVTERVSFGLGGTLEVAGQGYLFKIGRSSGGGNEVSVKPLSGNLIWWFWSETLGGIAGLLIDAQALVDGGRAKTWLDALCSLDRTMSSLWPGEK